MSSSKGVQGCSNCEQRILDASDPGDALHDTFVRDHLAACTECTDFFESLRDVKPFLDRYEVLEPTEELVQSVLGRTWGALPARPSPETTPIHAGMLRVVLAGLVSLPLVILINALMGWALYEVTSSLLPRTVAVYLVGLFGVWASMAVSLGYASLPLLDAIVRRPGGRRPAMADA